jgi:hypothetical protein
VAACAAAADDRAGRSRSLFARTGRLGESLVGGGAEPGVGCFCVLTHPLDDDVRALYAAFGFQDLPFDPARSMAVRIADLVRNGFGASD